MKKGVWSRRKKKGISHVEMIVSFSIFVLFVFFLFFYLNPLRHQNINEVLLNIVYEGIQEKAMKDIAEVPLKLNVAVGTCFSTDNPFSGLPKNILIKDSNRNIINFDVQSSKLLISASGDFYYLYFSEAISSTESSLSGCTDLTPDQYFFSVARIEKIYSMTNLTTIETLYNSGEGEYMQVKKLFNFPVNSDFNIKIYDRLDMSEIITMETPIPEKIDIDAEEFPIKIMSGTEEIEAILNIVVWE